MDREWWEHGARGEGKEDEVVEGEISLAPRPFLVRELFSLEKTSYKEDLYIYQRRAD